MTNWVHYAVLKMIRSIFINLKNAHVTVKWKGSLKPAGRTTRVCACVCLLLCHSGTGDAMCGLTVLTPVCAPVHVCLWESAYQVLALLPVNRNIENFLCGVHLWEQPAFSNFPIRSTINSIIKSKKYFVCIHCHANLCACGHGPVTPGSSGQLVGQPRCRGATLCSDAVRINSCHWICSRSQDWTEAYISAVHLA